ncbi:MAG: metallophosphoesterase [Desulfobacterales bacterium]|jgi:Icc-related predicted phosphoesterase
MKLLVIGDLHGQRPAIAFPDADLILAPGDFCSDAVRPYAFRAMAENDRQPDRRPVEWYDLLGREEAKDLVLESLADGRNTLESLNHQGLPVLVVPGNGDWKADPESRWPFLRVDHFLELISGLGRITDVDRRAITIGNLDVVGYGMSSGPEVPLTPEEWALFSPDQRFRLAAEYNTTLKAVADGFHGSGSPAVFLTHNVPYGTPLDIITDPSSPRCGRHFGSVIARRTVEDWRPAACIGGHMHEHFGMCDLSGVPVFNSGFGGRVNTLIEMDDGVIHSVRFHGGEPTIYPKASSPRQDRPE